jgi:general secretion pathway protein H
MLVVLAILGLAAGLGFPVIERAIARSAFEQSAATAAALVRGSRADAIRTGRPQTIVSLDRGHELWTPSRQGSVPVSVFLELRPARLSFYADGTSSGGTVTISSATMQRSYTLSRDTGLLQVAAP